MFVWVIFDPEFSKITHSHYEPYLLIGQVVNGRFWKIQGQILPVQTQTKEEWIFPTKLIFTFLYSDSYPHHFNKPTFDNPKQPFLVVVVVH